jgi:transposase
MQDRLLVGIDVGCRQHRVAIARSNGDIVKEFRVPHTASGFGTLFSELEHFASTLRLPIVIGMEGFHGYARPLDQWIGQKGYPLLNSNHLKLARFQELFSGPAKTDVIDARKIVELMRWAPHLQERRRVVTEVRQGDSVHQALKRLSRRRRPLVMEKVRIQNRMPADLPSVAPGLVDLAGSVDNLWFLHFLTARPSLRQLAGMRQESLLKTPGVGKK